MEKHAGERMLWGAWRIGFVLLAMVTQAAASLASTAEVAEDGPRIANAVRLEAGPTLDGDVLGDPAWSAVPAATGFLQNTPDEGQAASERTQVFIAYTDTTLYLGVVCHDRTPGDIVIADSTRDASLEETDSFQVILDTYADQQSGFVFGTNPAGIEVDGQVTGETSGERWTPDFGRVAKVESRPRRRSLECHERDGATRLS